MGISIERACIEDALKLVEVQNKSFYEDHITYGECPGYNHSEKQMIRRATINDVDNLVKLRIKLLNEAKKNIEDYDWYKYSQALKCYYNEGLVSGKVVAFLAEESGNTVAISIMCFYNICPSLFNLDGKIALITDMYTVPEYRNKGLGNKLLSNIMEYAKNLGYTKVTLNATDSGRRLYEKYGFKDIT